MSKQIAREEAIRLAINSLNKIDISARCVSLGLPVPENGSMPLRVFGKNLVLRLSDSQLLSADTGDPAKINDRILVLHYLLCEPPLVVTGDLISFRGFSEGQFYWQPFLSRTVNPLIQRIGNDLDLLKTQLQRFDWEPIEMGDFGAQIHALGKLYLTLAYHRGDDEFPPTADLLFDACIKKVFVAEDAAVLASRICIGLL